MDVTYMRFLKPSSRAFARAGVYVSREVDYFDYSLHSFVTLIDECGLLGIKRVAISIREKNGRSALIGILGYAREKDVLDLKMLHIATPLQRQGFGTGLVQYVVELEKPASMNGITSVNNEEAQAFWKGQGFTLTPHRDFFQCRWDAISARTRP